MCITNWGKVVLLIGAAMFYYKLGQTLLQIGAASLLQIEASVVANFIFHFIFYITIHFHTRYITVYMHGIFYTVVYIISLYYC